MAVLPRSVLHVLPDDPPLGNVHPPGQNPLFLGESHPDLANLYIVYLDESAADVAVAMLRDLPEIEYVGGDPSAEGSGRMPHALTGMCSLAVYSPLQ
jgi:hypothetical protein